jgi:hypothetical protein
LALATEGGALFVGAKRCQECHPKAYKKWLETPHSHAYTSLIKGRKGQEKNWIPRQYDPECLACHVTGWNPQDVVVYKSGFVSAQATAHLMHNQCENCHGPGSEHIRLINEGMEEEAKALVRVTLKQSRDRMCMQCHDLDNSPGFKFDEYWKNIAHPWTD